MPQNYVVARGQLGRYPVGSVLPQYIIEGAAGAASPAVRAQVVAELVEQGRIAPTDAPVNVELAPPAAIAATVPSSADDRMKRDLDDARKEIAALKSERDAHKSRADLAESGQTAVTTEIAKFIAENNHLRKACEEHQSRIDALEKENAGLKADLEAATAPTPKAPRKTVAA